MKHAGGKALEALGGLLTDIRKQAGLVERRPGVFYRKGHAFLHFHEDPAGLHADLRRGGDWKRSRVETAGERRAFLSRLRDALSEG
jgi:hypothetical protein